MTTPSLWEIEKMRFEWWLEHWYVWFILFAASYVVFRILGSHDR